MLEWGFFLLGIVCVFSFYSLGNRANLQRSWAELCCLGCTCLQAFWPRIVMRKWLNISARESDYSADTEEEDSNSGDSDTEGVLANCVILIFMLLFGLLENLGFGGSCGCDCYYWSFILTFEEPHLGFGSDCKVVFCRFWSMGERISVSK